MTRLLVIALPLLVLLTACDPTPPPVVEPSPVVEPVETTEPEEPTPAVADDYLVEYFPADAASEASELFHYAFWTDDTKAVRCDISVGGQSDPLASCFVMADFESRVTYAVPVGDEECADGYEVGVVAIPIDAGYDQPRAGVHGCAEYRLYPSAAIAADTLVLPSGAPLNLGPFRCEVTDAAASCIYVQLGASVTLGLTQIAVVS